MGGVASFIEDVAGGIVDAVSDVGSAIGGAIEDVGDFIGDTVQNALDDPVKTALQIAAVAAAPATGGASLVYGLPAIEAADILDEGGSVEDALKGAAITFATQQAVSFGVDSFGTSGVTPSGGETTQFWDDGSSIQWFDDGSSIVTDTAGQVTATPASDIVSPAVGDATGFVPSDVASGATAEAVANQVTPGAEVLPVASTGPAEIVPIPGTEGVTPQPQMPSLGDIAGTVQRFDDGSSLQFFDDGSTLATDPFGEVSYSPGTDLVSPGYVDPNAPGFNDYAAPVESRESQIAGAPPGVDRPLTDILSDIASEGGSALYNYATENPLTTLGVGAAIAGAMGEQPTPPTPPGETPRTFNYRPAAQVGSTRGLDELWSAANSIYGDRLTSMLGIPPGAGGAPSAPTPPPLLGGPAGGGIASLQRTYTPMSGGQTFDISTLSPEQIIRLQEIVARKKELG